MTLNTPPTLHAIQGCLIGTAIGDALGLAYEGLPPKRAARLFADYSRYHLLFGRGMVSDDTEQHCMVAQAITAANGDIKLFKQKLAWQLRIWLLLLPAGVGLATARAILKLWLGFSADKSGVWSAGNGAAMRSAILGVCYGHDAEKLQMWIRANTRITHTDPLAEQGAWLIAQAAFMASRGQTADFLPLVTAHFAQMSPSPAQQQWLHALDKLKNSVQQQQSTPEFAQQWLGNERGVTGYVLHTVPVCLQAWLSYPTDFAKAVQSVIACGGDADTTAAIVGALVGAQVGEEGIPAAWLAGIWEYPRSLNWIRRVSEQLHYSLIKSALPNEKLSSLNPLLLICRNLIFLCVVLFHGVRRLLPPY